MANLEKVNQDIKMARRLWLTFWKLTISPSNVIAISLYGMYSSSHFLYSIPFLSCWHRLWTNYSTFMVFAMIFFAKNFFIFTPLYCKSKNGNVFTKKLAKIFKMAKNR